MDIVARARRAAAILDDEVFKQAQGVVYDSCVDLFLNAGSTQDEIMEAHRIVRAQSKLTDALQSFIDDARMLAR
jgi:hypothetical protein